MKNWLMDRSYDRPWTYIVRFFFCHPCQPERDHCGRPEHDFCVLCGRLMPGQAKRAPTTNAREEAGLQDPVSGPPPTQSGTPE